MKRIYLSILFILSIVVIINAILGATVYKKLLPYYWGSDEISDKRYYLLSRSSEYNTLFIGSSKTHNQVIVQLFDSMAKAAGHDIRSYNFGVSGLTPMESLNIYQSLITGDSLRLKYAFIELDWVATIKYVNLNSTRSFYWLTPDNYSSSVSSVFASSMPAVRKGWGLFHYTVDFLENQLNTGKVQHSIELAQHTQSQFLQQVDSNITEHGYNPMFSKMNSSETDLFEEVVTSSRSAIKDSLKLKTASFSSPYLNKLQSLVDLSRSKGIVPVFVVPLQWKFYQYRELLPIISRLKNVAIITMFNYDSIPDAYQPELFADPNHLNATGARAFTQNLFDKSKELIH